MTIPNDDTPVVADVCTGDVVAEWWGLYRGDVRARLGDMTRDHGLADDLTVETFVRLIRHLRLGRPTPDNPKAWLRVTSRRLLIDHLRRSAVRAEEPRADMPVMVSFSDFDAVARSEEARAWLDTLDPRQRTIMELRDFHDLSTAEVAGILGMTEQAVRSARHKAVVHLRGRGAPHRDVAEEASA